MVQKRLKVDTKKIYFWYNWKLVQKNLFLVHLEVDIKKYIFGTKIS
jgi:hypothetical protein